MPKNTTLSTDVNEETLALLKESYPIETGNQRINLPRLGLYAKDQTEGKGKAMKVTTEAGVFFINKPTDEEGEDGKKLWVTDELGTSIDGIILFQRKALSFFDGNAQSYTKSPVYDNDDEVIPLFCEGAEVGRGTPAELKAMYEFEEDGKKKSKLKDNRVLYVEYKGSIYQMTLGGSSMFSFLTYSRKIVPPSVITTFSSEPKQKGSNAWNQMTFNAKRKLTQPEALDIVNKVREIKEVIRAEKSQYAGSSKGKADREFDAIPSKSF